MTSKEEKDYVWVWVKNHYANDWNNEPERELRKYRVKERKEKCIVLFHKNKQYPYSQCYDTEEQAMQGSDTE